MIKIDEDFGLTWDSHCFSLCARTTVKFQGKPGPDQVELPESQWTEKWSPFAHYGRISHAIVGYLTHKIRSSPPSSMEALIDLLGEIQENILEFKEAYPKMMKPDVAGVPKSGGDV